MRTSVASLFGPSQFGEVQGGAFGESQRKCPNPRAGCSQVAHPWGWAVPERGADAGKRSTGGP